MIRYDLPTPILIATSNPAKEAKLRWVLEGLPLDSVLLTERPDITLPDETGTSFIENAMLKAIQASLQFDGLAIASDGGVRILALPPEAWDALRTGRAAGVGASDAERAQHLLSLMRDVHGAARRVLWSEAVAVADNGTVLAAWESDGTDGVLTEAYDPANAMPGFWVYSLWHFPSLGKRYVDLTPEELAREDLTWGILKSQVQVWFAQQ